MAWVYLDDQMSDHPKMVLAGDEAAWMFTCGLMYCRRFATEGFIPAAQVPKLTNFKRPLQLAAKLVAVVLWHATGHDCERCPDPGPDRYVVHDYGDWNKPQESRSHAGRKAANARWAKERAQGHAHAVDDANAYANASVSQSDRTADPDASTCPPPHPPPLGTSDTQLPVGRGHPEADANTPVVTVAARILARLDHEAAKARGDEIRNHEAWRKAAVTRRMNDAALLELAAAKPTWNGQQLADAIAAGVKPRPEDGTVAAQAERIRRNAERDAEAKAIPPATDEERKAAIAEAKRLKAEAAAAARTDRPSEGTSE